MNAKPLLRLAATASGILLLTLSVYYPRPFTDDATKASIERMVKSAMPKGREREEMERKLRKVAKHRGTLEYSIGMPIEAIPGETKPSAESSAADLRQSPREKLLSAPPLVVVKRHGNGAVSGSITSADGKTEMEFQCPDTGLPARVEGQVRKYDLNRSDLFKAVYGILAATFCGTAAFFLRSGRGYSETGGSHAAETGSLREYMNHSDAVKEGVITRKEFRAMAARGDAGPGRANSSGNRRYRPYWDDIALAAVMICCVMFGVYWRGYLNPQPPWPDRTMIRFIDDQLARGGRITEVNQ